MKPECCEWRDYADENLAVAEMALDEGYYNACLQNAQQAVEKFLKAKLLDLGLGFPRTHSISLLNRILLENGSSTGLADDECDLLDTIYVPSKYPLGGALPDFSPDADICRKCLDIVQKAKLLFTSGK